MARRQINAEELHILFTLIGQSIWYLQMMEDALHTTITVKRDVRTPGAIPENEANSLLAQHRSKTLGHSLKISRQAQIFHPDLQKRLESFKEERDWLVHRSVNQNGDDLYLDEKRVDLIERITAFSEEARTLQKLIERELEDFVVSHGLNRESIHQVASETIRKLKGD